MHGPNGVIFDSINRWSSNRNLLIRDRGAFNIQERNIGFRKEAIIARYKKATPAYLKKLRAQIKNDQANRRRKITLNLSLCLIIFSALIYMAYAVGI